MTNLIALVTGLTALFGAIAAMIGQLIHIKNDMEQFARHDARITEIENGNGKSGS